MKDKVTVRKHFEDNHAFFEELDNINKLIISVTDLDNFMIQEKYCPNQWQMLLVNDVNLLLDTNKLLIAFDLWKRQNGEKWRSENISRGCKAVIEKLLGIVLSS